MTTRRRLAGAIGIAAGAALLGLPTLTSAATWPSTWPVVASGDDSGWDDSRFDDHGGWDDSRFDDHGGWDGSTTDDDAFDDHGSGGHGSDDAWDD